MKILQVVPYFFPAWSYGGPAKVVYDTALTLASLGHEVTVYTSDAFDEKQRMPKAKKIARNSLIRVVYFKNLVNAWAYKYNLHIPIGLFLTVPFSLALFDVIHIHDFYTLSNVWITFFALLYKIPYGISVHGCLESKRLEQKALFKRIFLSLFGNRILQKASFVIATSQQEYQAYLEYGVKRDKIVKIGHGVRRSEFETTVSQNDARKRFGIPTDAVVFSFIGRFHYIKGVDLLIDAFNALKRKNTWLIIAGSDDGYLSKIKEKIDQSEQKDRIICLGQCVGDDKAQVFKASTVFVYPSRSEGFSLGILEAGSVGLPLLITDQCHFSAVEKFKAGIIVPVTVAGLHEGLVRFSAMHESELEKIGNNAASLIATDYSMTTVGKKLLQAYENSR